MRTMHTNPRPQPENNTGVWEHHTTTPVPPPPPAPIEWSSDYTARAMAAVAADVAKIRKWVTFFGVCVVIWLCIMGLMLMTTIGALSDT